MHTLPLPGPLVDAAWLKAHLGHPDLVVLDASWHLPASGRSGAAEFLERHVPGALFFDFDGRIKDPDSPLPHMLPPPSLFQAELRALGIWKGSAIVCYDSAGIFSAPRAWWMFRAMGHQRVAVLDGGLPAWTDAGGELAAGASPPGEGGDFVSRFDAAWVRNLAEVRALIGSGEASLVDARTPGRFQGTEPEPRPGLRSGHMPGALNLPFGELLVAGRYLPAPQLRNRFAALAPPGQPLVFSCGSGVTACVLALGACLAGRSEIAVYDGSWTEWASAGDTPVITGPR